MQIPESAFIINASDSTDRCFVISAGIHGNEPVGANALTSLRELIDTKDWVVDGAVYGLIGNPRAAEKNVRFIDENLNRAFGTPLSNTYESGRAQEIVTWLEELSRTYTNVYLLDLHSVSIGDTTMTIYCEDNEKARAWADEISPIPFRLTYREEVMPGALIGVVHKLGGIGVAIECGNHVSERGADVALEHIENALMSLGFLKAHTRSYRNNSFEGERRTYSLLAPVKPTHGFRFTVDPVSELFLKEGEVYAEDPVGVRHAPSDCYLMMPSKDPQPEDFDAGFLAIKN